MTLSNRFSLDRIVGSESQKTYIEKVKSGFFDNYLSGQSILDVGFAGHGGEGQPIVPNAIGVDRDYPGYDGTTLPFADGSQDAVYSSHCFEHIENHIGALRDWLRVVKVGGYIIIVVPHQHLFERRVDLPSRWNKDHKRFFTPSTLLASVEEALPVNSYRVRYLRDNDRDFDYSVTPELPVGGCYEIELVLEKIHAPAWSLEDYAIGDFAPDRFNCARPRGNQWWLEHDLSQPGPGCWIWGPYVPLKKGCYRARFGLELIDLADGPLGTAVKVDIGRDGLATGSEQRFIGQEGADAIRRGEVTLDFEVAKDDAQHEFRTYVDGATSTGRLRFYGVNLVRTDR